jgi:hypothetical protein
MKFRAIILLLLALAVSCTSNSEEARVFVFTDINIDKGDPDDRQSLVHLFWYADEIDIEGIVPDRWNAQGYEACMLALEAYATDYSSYDFINKGYPSASELENHIAQDMEHARKLFFEAASNACIASAQITIAAIMRASLQIARQPEIVQSQ